MEQPRSPEEKLAVDKVNESIRFDGERYELPPNGQMAEKRLHTVEKKLMQDEKLAQAYQSVVDDNFPHFPVVRPEKATKKVRVVFDGSAQQNGKSLVLSCKVTLWMFKLSLEGSQLPYLVL